MARKQAGGGSGGVLRVLTRGLLTFATCIFLLVAVVGLVARALPEGLQALPWVPDVVAFAPWMVLAAVISLVCALASKHWLMALMAVFCAVASLWYQAPFFQSSGQLPEAAVQAATKANADTRDGYARVMTANVYKGRADPQAIMNLVRDGRVEVLALQETTKSFVHALDADGLGDYLPYSQVASSDGKYGNGLWSATPLEKPVDDDVNSDASFMPGGTVQFAGGSKNVRFVSVHTTSPKPGYWSQWQRSLSDLQALQSHKGTRYVFMGDFNATYDHAAFRDFLGGRFIDAAEESGKGLDFTWPNNKPFVPRFAGIDHIVIDTGMSAGQVASKPVPGSDHAALLATIAV